MLVARGHHVLLHGRNPAKLERVEAALSNLADGGRVESHVADLSRLADVEALAVDVTARHAKLDVLINNAGVFKTPDPVTGDGLDIRFVVNTIAPYLLTQRLLPLIGPSGRVVNLSSAAQSPVNLEALAGQVRLSDMEAYAQSKLALTIWSAEMAKAHKSGPVIVAINPGSLLASKMVKEGFGVEGGDLRIGADILIRAALSDEFETATGQYFDNDKGRFAAPHAEARDTWKAEAVMQAIKTVLADMT